MREAARHERSDCGSFIVDRGETILGFDQAMEELTGWPAFDVVGHHKDLRVSRGRSVSGMPIQTVPLYDGRLIAPPSAGSIELTLRCRDGRWLDVDALARPLSGPGERTLVTVLRVVTTSPRRVFAAETAGLDDLTGLLDRDAFARYLAADLAQARALASPLSLILLDVDQLRAINDRHGHATGAEVLREIARIMRETCEGEPRLARLGDDDFAVLLLHGGRGEARQLAGAVRARVERWSTAAETAQPARATISVGTASFPTDADDELELLARAGEALDEARRMGRNRVWCYLRRPRVPLQVPVYFDGADPSLLGYTRDLSPSGIFVQTTAALRIGMRCALAFPLPGHDGRLHVIGRVVRTIPAPVAQAAAVPSIPGVGVEFERFGDASDRRAIDSYVHRREATTLRPERGRLSL